jgi:hypothetical protein
MASDSGAAPPKRAGCLGRALGCIGIAAALMVLSIVSLAVLPGWEARRIRESIAPGMSMEEVIERAGHWLSCRAYAGPPDKRIVDLEVWPSRFGEPLSSTQQSFASKAEMARALADEMKSHGVPWRMTFGYITLVPKRIYFDVDFSKDGRVERVSDTRWGGLN